MQRADVHQTLTRILAEESHLLGELEAILQQETAVVSGDDIAAIQQIGANRHRCVDLLTRLDTERCDTCRILSFGSGRAALDKLFEWADSGTTLRKQWHANLKLARRCKSLNDQNGTIVAAKLGRVHKLLSAMRGTPTPPVYNARGSRYGSLGCRDLGSA